MAKHSSGSYIVSATGVSGAMFHMTFVGKTVLFVDDDLVVQMAYRLRLEREGFIIRTASDGLEAMRLLSQFPPDVVILDLMLPKMNGVM